MEYIGIDLHKRNFVACIMDRKGKVLHPDSYANTSASLTNLLAVCSDKPRIVLEATLNWQWLVSALQERTVDVALAHPLRTKAIASARIKTDKIDAETLAHLLRSNLVPKSYIATPQEQADRDLARARCQLVRQKTWLKNQVHALLTKANLIPPVTDLFGKKGRSWLADQPLSVSSRLIVDQWLSLLETTEEKIGNLKEQMAKRAVGNRQIQILESIPGFGLVTAFTLAAEIGNAQRFPDGNRMAAYFGLVPSLYQSGNTRRQGSITKLGNPYARWVLVQAAHRLVRQDGNVKLAYLTLAARRGKKRAIVAGPES